VAPDRGRPIEIWPGSTSAGFNPANTAVPARTGSASRAAVSLSLMRLGRAHRFLRGPQVTLSAGPFEEVTFRDFP
jgi:hypothetical protein